MYKHVCKQAGHARTHKIIKKTIFYYFISNKYNVIPHNLGIILEGFFSRILFCKFCVTIQHVTSVFDIFYDVLLQF